MNIIAFDLGGSGGKVVLSAYTDGELTLTPLQVFEHSPIPVGRHLYWDILRIYEELNSGVKKAVELTNDTITSLGIDSFCNDFAIVTPSGELLTQIHSYRDCRTSLHEQEIYVLLSPQTLYQITGNQRALFNTFMQLGAMRFENESYMLEHGNQILFIPDLLHFFLSGKRITEYTLASVSQLYDIRTNCFSHEILNALSLSPSLFADVVKPGTIFASTSAKYNASMHTKGFALATVCEHDTASAFLGSTCTGRCALISCGTWALVGTEADAPVINEFGYQYNIANEGGAPGRHHRILRNVMGTWIIQEIRSFYKKQGKTYSYSELEALAERAKPFQYYIDVDDLLFYSPGNMPEKIQQYCAKRYGSYPLSIGEMVLAIYENLAFKFRWNIEKLSTCTGTHFDNINILGGGSQSHLLCQFTASACRLPLTAGPVEATVLGNTIMQLIANGQIADVEEGREIIRRSFKTTAYAPQNSELWEQNYQKYKHTLNLD